MSSLNHKAVEKLQKILDVKLLCKLESTMHMGKIYHSTGFFFVCV
jgi:hypothetical protein